MTRPESGMSTLIMCFGLFVVLRGSSVVTTSGILIGATTRSGNVTAFYSVPFAVPPLGPLRFMAPVPFSTLTHIDVGKPGRACMQPQMGTDQMSEDCLTLSLWVPPRQNGSLLATMVWLHGGGFVEGRSDWYSGEDLSRDGGIIVVSVQYRLGVFGFLALQEEMPGHEPGFAGVLDQRLALEWVAKNIAQFGGDPRRVTLAGESAGGLSACLHLVLPNSSMLFSRVIMESGGCLAKDWSEAFSQSQLSQRAVGCADLACMQSILAGDLLNKSDPYGPWAPAINGRELKMQPWQMLSKGNLGKPALLGTNQHEFSLGMCSLPGFTSKNFSQNLERVFGNLTAQRIASLYPLQNFQNPTQAYVRIITDWLWTCSAGRWVSDVLAAQSQSVFLYQLSLQPSWSNPCRGASHEDELPFLFPSSLQPLFPKAGPPTSFEASLGSCLRALWGQFVGGGPLRSWPLFQLNHSDYLEIGSAGLRSGENYGGDLCVKFWFKENMPNPWSHPPLV